MASLPSVSFPGEMEPIQAAALVSQPALYSKELLDEHPVGPAMVHPSETAVSGPRWMDLFEPGVKRALVVGIGLQILEQFAGINGVLYYTPQIVTKAGVTVILENIGISSDSASLLISAFTTFLMLPCILVAMWLMDKAGRRQLLLTTIPVLVISLMILLISSAVQMGEVLQASISCVGVIGYICCFVAGFGPIPNIVCAEIFPTSVRGVCIAICSLSMWIGDIIVTYTLPLLLDSVGIVGICGIYAAVCCVSWVFVFLKVPETKGMPLEVITEFFAMSSVVKPVQRHGSQGSQG
uniref:Major facilitator superfamily (MFS) profile domain-containing protein n=1 Tax=Araucaria cunninghamii TaxID=56994 RepID=A0A0D6QUX5_ARACU